ncbi:uncharacterized protein B0T15DRAFT_108500 [Chaetomium strumarium]|uniref:Uncharacterized protein n=1 Tax=Chaetomium strumarium TaxID=1170767 RepID=A0AAJ0GZ78_9PEZI|nr:hypothetical protein B0T15DRAFT_108500 [Chaetomium strumarium]
MVSFQTDFWDTHHSPILRMVSSLQFPRDKAFLCFLSLVQAFAWRSGYHDARRVVISSSVAAFPQVVDYDTLIHNNHMPGMAIMGILSWEQERFPWKNSCDVEVVLLVGWCETRNSNLLLRLWRLCHASVVPAIVLFVAHCALCSGDNAVSSPDWCGMGLGRWHTERTCTQASKAALRRIPCHTTPRHVLPRHVHMLAGHLEGSWKQDMPSRALGAERSACDFVSALP